MRAALNVLSIASLRLAVIAIVALMTMPSAAAAADDAVPEVDISTASATESTVQTVSAGGFGWYVNDYRNNASWGDSFDEVLFRNGSYHSSPTSTMRWLLTEGLQVTAGRNPSSRYWLYDGNGTSELMSANGLRFRRSHDQCVRINPATNETIDLPVGCRFLRVSDDGSAYTAVTMSSDWRSWHAYFGRVGVGVLFSVESTAHFVSFAVPGPAPVPPIELSGDGSLLYVPGPTPETSVAIDTATLATTQVTTGGYLFALSQDGRSGLAGKPLPSEHRFGQPDYITSGDLLHFALAPPSHDSSEVSVSDVAQSQAGQIRRLFVATQGRYPSRTEQDHAARLLSNGSSLAQLAATLDGTEATYSGLSADQLVETLFRKVLGRDPDDPGRQHWLETLGEGATWTELLVAFTESPEYLQRTKTTPPAPDQAVDLRLLYRVVFGREPDQAGFDYWLDQSPEQLGSGGLLGALLASPEAVGRYEELDDRALVTAAYRTALGREPDLAGLSYWTDRLANGLSRSSLFLELLSAPEFRARAQSPR